MKTTNLDKLHEILKIKNAAEEETKVEFGENLNQLFVDNPTLRSFSMTVNNHEFNDGDPTRFSLYYESVTVTDTDGNEVERDDYSCKPDRNLSHPLVVAVYNLFEKYDIGDIYEELFGSDYDGLTISAQNVSEYMTPTDK